MSHSGSGALDTTPRRASILAFLTAGVTLFAQVLVHRVVSAKLLNNYAFLVISLTMLGFAFSGTLLSRILPRVLPRAGEVLLACSALFALSLVLCSFFFYRADAGTQYVLSRPDFVRAAGRWMPLALLYSVPFAFCGLILGLLLSTPTLPTRMVYFADLVGSGLGALAVIPAISGLGVERSLLLAAAILLGGTLFLFPPRRGALGLLAGAAALALAAGAIRPHLVFNMRYPPGSMLAIAQASRPPYGIEAIVWDPVARIEVMRIPPPDPGSHPYPCLIGGNPSFLERFDRMLSQNNNAFTYAVRYDGRRESLEGIEETIYSAAYQAAAAPNPRVLVVGVGGGFDILNALAFGASQVTGVEINSATVDILNNRYRDYFRPWVQDPRVRLLTGEGRHYLATHAETYDVLQLSAADSFSGTPGAAHVFSENYLYTAEAFDLYLSRLNPRGILNMMRFEYPFPRDAVRALSTVVAALRRDGAARPANHIITLTSRERNYVALLVKKTPFTDQEEARLAAWAGPNPYFGISASPHLKTDNPTVYQSFLELNDPQQEARAVASYPFDISPATDDRPFFHNYAFWWHLFPADPMVWGNVPAMQMSVLLLLLMVGVAAVGCVYLPLRPLSGEGAPAPAQHRFALFFAAIAIGYLAIEVALLQKFGLFLGHPNYALSVVLAALLISTGLGSLVSSVIVSRLGQLRYAPYLLAVVVFLEYFLAFPRLRSWIGAPFAIRATVVAILVVPIGMTLGVFLPSGLERLKASAPPMAAWGWGVNGIFSVMAPILSVAFSMTWGIDALLLAALPVYLVAGFSLPAAPIESIPPSPVG